MNESQSATTTRRADRKRSPFRTWLLGVIVLLAIRLVGGLVPIAGASGWLWITRISEAWLVGGLLLWALSAFPAKEIFKAIGVGRTVVVVALTASMFMGQYIQIDSYPFVQWSMYTGSMNRVTFGESRMVFADGSVSPLPLRDDALLSKEPRVIGDRLLGLASDAASGDSLSAEILDQTVRALVADIRGPAPEKVEIRRCVVEEPTPTGTVSCEIEAEVTIEGANG